MINDSLGDYAGLDRKDGRQVSILTSAEDVDPVRESARIAGIASADGARRVREPAKWLDYQSGRDSQDLWRRDMRRTEDTDNLS